MFVEGCHKLKDKIRIGGAKKSAVALLPSAILVDSEITIDRLSEFSDVYAVGELLEEIGGEVTWDGHTAHIDPKRMISMPLPNGLVKQLRASYYFMGAMLGKFNRAVIGLPGGCYLGPRPI